MYKGSMDIAYLVKDPGFGFNWADEIHRRHGWCAGVTPDVHAQATRLSPGTRHGC